MTSGVRVILAVAAVASLACRSPPPTSVAEGDDHFWGAEAVEFFDAHARAICSQDVHSVVAFYDADVIADYRGLTLGRFSGQLREGRHQMISFVDLCLFSPTSDVSIEIVELFLHPGGAVSIEHWIDRDTGQEATVAALTTLGPDGIELIRYFRPGDGPDRGWGDPPTAPALAPIAALAGLRWPDRLWSEIEVYGFRVEDGEVDQVLLVVDTDRGGCLVRTADWWAVGDGRIGEERSHLGVESGRCLDRDEASTGWWTGRDLPVPLDERLTATALVGDRSIDFYNSDPEREALAIWAIERFEARGLEPPDVDQIIFEPSRRCQELSGLAHLSAQGATIYQCVQDVTCTSSSCDRFTNHAKLSMLHELAHPWLEEHLASEARQALVGHTPATSWGDASIEWGERGVEWAAEILAWGLLDRPFELLRLGFPPCELRIEVFQLLTDRPPMNGCEGP